MATEHDAVIWPNRDGLGKVLGDLELLVMDVIWAWPGDYPVTVKDVHLAIQERRPLAYTSVLSTMGNLVKKGALRVEKKHFAHRFWPSSSRAEYEDLTFGRLIGTLVSDATAPVIQHFVASLEKDPEALDALYELIQQRRREADR